MIDKKLREYKKAARKAVADAKRAADAKAAEHRRAIEDAHAKKEAVKQDLEKYQVLLRLNIYSMDMYTYTASFHKIY